MTWVVVGPVAGVFYVATNESLVAVPYVGLGQRTFTVLKQLNHTHGVHFSPASATEPNGMLFLSAADTIYASTDYGVTFVPYVTVPNMIVFGMARHDATKVRTSPDRKIILFVRVWVR